MSKPAPSYLFWAAICSFILAAVLGVISQTIVASSDTRRGLIIIAVSLTLFGIAEVINHPRRTSLEFNESDQSVSRFTHRIRTPSGLGNLLFIFSLLLFCIGLARLVSF